MSDQTTNRSNATQKTREQPARTKKSYQKPSFQHERVFETMALTCGKLADTGGPCVVNRKNS